MITYPMQYIEDLPVAVFASSPQFLRQTLHSVQNCAIVCPLQDCTTHDDHGLVSFLQSLAKFMFAIQNVSQSLEAVSQVLILVWQIHWGSDDGDISLIVDPGLPEPGVYQWSLEPRVGADQQDQVAVLNASDGGVHDVVGAEVNAGETIKMQITDNWTRVKDLHIYLTSALPGALPSTSKHK